MRGGFVYASGSATAIASGKELVQDADQLEVRASVLLGVVLFFLFLLPVFPTGLFLQLFLSLYLPFFLCFCLSFLLSFQAFLFPSGRPRRGNFRAGTRPPLLQVQF